MPTKDLKRRGGGTGEKNGCTPKAAAFAHGGEVGQSGQGGAAEEKGKDREFVGTTSWFAGKRRKMTHRTLGGKNAGGKARIKIEIHKCECKSPFVPNAQGGEGKRT